MPSLVTELANASKHGSDPGGIARGLYRFGFLLLPAARSLAPDAEMAALAETWQRLDLDDLLLWSHPETRLVVADRGNLRLVLIGEAYSSSLEAPDKLLAEAPVATDADLRALGDGLGGRFALLVQRAGEFRVLHDAFGSRSVFYTPREPRAIASHAALLAQALGLAESPEVASLIASEDYRKRKVKYLPGDWTLFGDVFALIPNNLYDSSARETRRYWPVGPRGTSSFAEFVAAADSSFDAMVPFVTAHYRALFGITGGIDSRTLVGAFRSRGAPMAGVTWGGGFLDRREKPSVDRLVNELGVEHRYLDTGRMRTGEISEVSLRNSGGFRDPSRLTQGMADLYPDGDDSIFVRGYGGEIIRGFYNMSKSPMRDFSATAMRRAYNVGGAISSHSAEVLEMFEGFRRRGNYHAIEALGFDPNDIFYWEHRMGMWGACMLNEMDAAMRSLVGFNDRNLYAVALGLPDQERLTKLILHRLLAASDPAIAALDTPPQSKVPAPAVEPRPATVAATTYPAPTVIAPAGVLQRVGRRLGLVAPAPDRKLAAVARTSSAASGTHKDGGTDLLYYHHFRMMIRFLGPNAQSMIDVGSGHVPYLEWFDWVPRRVSVDTRRPYSSDAVEGYQGDILALDFGDPFDICTCMQVLEHVREPKPFARRLLKLGRLVLVSVPYKWPEGQTTGHVQDPVDLKKLSGWFGRKPNYHQIVQEPFLEAKGARLFALYDPADPARRFGSELRKNRRPLRDAS